MKGDKEREGWERERMVEKGMLLTPSHLRL